MSSISRELYKSLILKYTSEIQASKSTLMIYFNNNVAIGEHPQHLEEMDTLLNNMAESNDKLENLKKHFENDYN